MAIIFSLWIENKNKDDEYKIASYFKNLTINIDNRNYKTEYSGNGMITIIGISDIVRDNPSPKKLTKAGFELFKLLKSAPSFRYGIVGTEVDEWRLMKELEEEPEDISIIPGFVIREDIYEKLGSPGKMKRFKPNYFWNEYKGES